MIDRIEITVRGGQGGAGCVSFRREKFVPRGGPDGGDGGDGGSVTIVSNGSVRTLKEIGRRRIYQAQRGQHGMGSDKHGRRGEALAINVPPGTEVSRQGAGGWEKIHDLTNAGESAVVARGGLGGWGNARFATSTNQAPRIAQTGQVGEEARLRLDLKLLADVGLVGLPNAGKSTLLRAMSAARPRVADYPFTTLEPMLGVVENGWTTFVVADIPGLIEGAHEGAGLGLEFLRHIERTRVIVHLIDGSSADAVGDMDAVNAELREYGRGLENRGRVVAINKVDIPEVAAGREGLRKRFAERGIEVMFISGVVGTGVEELTDMLAKMLEDAPQEAAVSPEVTVAPTEETGGMRVRREDGGFRVEGERVVAFAEMMPVGVEEGRAEVWRRFRRWGVTRALKRAGAKRGDRVLLGSVELEVEG